MKSISLLYVVFPSSISLYIFTGTVSVLKTMNGEWRTSLLKEIFYDYAYVRGPWFIYQQRFLIYHSILNIICLFLTNGQYVYTTFSDNIVIWKQFFLLYNKELWEYAYLAIYIYNAIYNYPVLVFLKVNFCEKVI